MKILFDGVIEALLVKIIIIVRGDMKIIKIILTQKDCSLISVIQVDVLLEINSEVAGRSQMIKKRSR